MQFLTLYVGVVIAHSRVANLVFKYCCSKLFPRVSFFFFQFKKFRSKDKQNMKYSTLGEILTGYTQRVSIRRTSIIDQIILICGS